jgi:demethylmenaquinone methyltransferase/2-methoxy-6-polyprenyl-1,4-benzoquinol methylase
VNASPKTQHAQRLFAGIAPQYERMGALLSFGQDARWRRTMVSKVNAIPGSWVLDVAAGTGLVSRELAARKHVHVASLDPSEPMLRSGAAPARVAGLDRQIHPILGRGETLPFADETFDSVTFTYLLRYVDDPQATMRELARVLRPGGTLASLEFFLPRAPLWHRLWLLYTRGVMPVAGAAVSPAWARTGAFLGRSISRFYATHPLPEQVRWWQAAGLRHVRSREMSLGGGIVIWAVKAGPLDG